MSTRVVGILVLLFTMFGAGAARADVYNVNCGSGCIANDPISVNIYFVTHVNTEQGQWERGDILVVRDSKGTVQVYVYSQTTERRVPNSGTVGGGVDDNQDDEDYFDDDDDEGNCERTQLDDDVESDFQCDRAIERSSVRKESLEEACCT